MNSATKSIPKQGGEPNAGAEQSFHPEEPRFCPLPQKDLGGKKDFDKLYQEYIGTVMNPQTEAAPLPAELGYALVNPATGKPVYYDHCRDSNGNMIDAKGHYEDLLSSGWGKDLLAEKWTQQASDQIAAAAANDGRQVEWFFHEEATMDFARNLFERIKHA